MALTVKSFYRPPGKCQKTNIFLKIFLQKKKIFLQKKKKIIACFFVQVKNGGQKVDLSGMYLRDEEAKQIAKALIYPTMKVQELNLSRNYIQFSGALALANALETNENTAASNARPSHTIILGGKVLQLSPLL